MAICSYNGKRLQPAPLVTISKEYQKAGDGTIIGSVFLLTINGIILSFNGSPYQDGEFYDGSWYAPDARQDPTFMEDINEYDSFGYILRKQEAIRELFSEEGKSLEFQAFDGSPPIKCNPRISRKNFPEGVWFNRSDYTIELEADVLYISGTEYGEDDFEDKISTCSESWNIETVEDTNLSTQHTYRVTHEISATGKRFYNKEMDLEKEAWEQAKSFCLKRSGFDNGILFQSVLDISTLNRYNYIKNENFSKTDGTYSLTEAWVLSDDGAIETFSVSTQNDGAESTVSVEGTITGMSFQDSASPKIDAAESKLWLVQSMMYSRAQQYSGLTLNINPLSYNISRDVVPGIITYNYEYTATDNLFDDTITDSITIEHSHNVDVFAEIFVLGRIIGPVLQPLGAKESKTISVNIEATFPVSKPLNYNNPFMTTHAGQIEDIMLGVLPPDRRQTFVNQNQYSWNPTTGTASISRGYTYE